MKKKLIITISTVALTVALGLGIYQSDATNLDPKLSTKDIKQMVNDQYPGQITEIELKKKRDKVVYEVDVVGDNKEYEIKFDGDSGEVLKLEEKTIMNNETIETKDKEDTNKIVDNGKGKDKGNNKGVKKDVQTTKGNAVIDIVKAIEIARAEYPGTVTEVELDEEDGQLIYEVEIKGNGEEADIEIDAYTGEIIVIEIDN